MSAGIFSNYSGLVNTAILPIYPAVGSLPSTAIDGATAITLDTHDLYIYVAGTGWSAGSGTGPIATSQVSSTNVPIATAGFMRLGNADAIEWRNSTNTGNLSLSMEGAAAERFVFNNAIVSQLSSTASVRSIFSNPGVGASSQVKVSLSMFDDVDLYANSVAGGATAGINIGSGFTGGFTIQQLGAHGIQLYTNGAIGFQLTGASVINIGSALSMNIAATAAQVNTILPATNDGAIVLGGDSSAGSGGVVQVYGHTHATLPSYVQVLNSGALTMRFDANNNAIVRGSALTTSATNGFLYIPGGPGAPTGVPTAVTGCYPLYWNTTNKKLYIYDGAWLGGTAPGAWS